MVLRDIFVREAQSVRDWALQHNAPFDLCCWCAICSYEIFKRLKQAHFSPVFVDVETGYGGHCYVKCAGYLIDVTAQQFNRRHPPVIVVRKPPSNDWYWSEKTREDLVTRRAYTFEGIKSVLKTWPCEQKPKKW